MERMYINQGLFIVLCIVAVIGVVSSLLLLRKTHNVRKKLNNISDTLDDIAQGNSNLKILAKPSDMTSAICYQINDIIYNFREQIIDLKKRRKQTSN